MKRLLFLAGIAALAACATARPVKQLAPWFDVANAENPKYPHARFITGVGSSEVSSDDADARAKANIAAQISSRVKSETSSFQEFTSRTGNTAENVVSRVSVNSEFSRADLVAVVQHEKQGETFYSYAALERKSADGELAQASAADLVRFESAVANSARAHLDHDSGVFGSAAADALSVRPRLDTAFVMRRAIAGHRAVAEEEHYAASLKELIQNLASAREHQVVGVVFTKASGNHLGDLAINAVKHIGLRPDSLSCTDRDESTWSPRPAAAAPRERGPWRWCAGSTPATWSRRARAPGGRSRRRRWRRPSAMRSRARSPPGRRRHDARPRLPAAGRDLGDHGEA
jgi:hypothetical protein